MRIINKVALIPFFVTPFLRFGWVGVLVFIAVGAGDATLAQHEQKNEIWLTKRVLRPDGWVIPRIVDGKAARQTLTIIDGIQIRERAVIPVNPIVSYEDLFQRPSGELLITRRRHPIILMSELSVGKKVFAYAIRYAAGMGNVGGVFDVTYLDMNGDGIFEERVQGREKPAIPQWVRTRKIRN